MNFLERNRRDGKSCRMFLMCRCRAHALCPICGVGVFHSKTFSPRRTKSTMTSSVRCNRWMNTAKLVVDLEHCRRFGMEILLEPMNFPENPSTHTRRAPTQTSHWKMCADIWKRDETMCRTHPCRSQSASYMDCVFSRIRNDNSISPCWMLFDEFLFIFFVCGCVFVVAPYVFMLRLYCRSIVVVVFTFVCLKCVRISDLDSAVLWAVQLLYVWRVCRFTIRAPKTWKPNKMDLISTFVRFKRIVCVPHFDSLCVRFRSKCARLKSYFLCSIRITTREILAKKNTMRILLMCMWKEWIRRAYDILASL